MNIEKDIAKLNKYTKEIVELIHDSHDMTDSDVQGAVMGIVAEIIAGDEVYKDYIEDKMCGEPRLVEDDGGGVILQE